MGYLHKLVCQFTYSLGAFFLGGLFIGFVFPKILNGAPVNSLKGTQSKSSNFAGHSWINQVDQVKSTLSLPIPNRYEVLRTQGAMAIPVLEYLSFDQSSSYRQQWNAITALAQLQKTQALKIMERALESSKWYHRNAGLLGIFHCNKQAAYKWSLRLLKDPALFVRTAAVQTLIRLDRRQAAALLWDELYSKQNYRGEQSLWVRKYIAKALARFAKAGDKTKFIKMLKDKDLRLHRFAILGLEKSTGEIKGRGLPMTSKRKSWLASL